MTSTSVALSPLTLGGTTIKNRLVVTAHTYGLLDGQTSGEDAMLAYVSERIAGGFGAVIMGETTVDPTGGGWGAASSDEGIIEFYQRVADAARPHGTLVIEQLYSPGGQVWHEEEKRAFAPSSVPQARSSVVPSTLTESQIQDQLSAFVSAAQRAARGGLSGVEVKADQGKLIHQFLARRYNRRTDSWGGETLAERASFLVSLLSQLRSNCPGLVLGVRLPMITDSTLLALGDLSFADSVQTASELSDRGLVDYVSFSIETNSTARGYWIGHPDPMVDLTTYKRLLHSARQSLSVPVLYAGAALTVESADEILDQGVSDLVAMTRASIADPGLVTKHLEGRDDSIRPCIACNDGCVGNTWYGRPVRCSINPRAGRESLLRPMSNAVNGTSSGSPVWVIGAGPAGLQCALTLAELGFSVVVHERESRPGGLLRLASQLEGRARLALAIEYLEHAVRRSSKVELKFGSAIDPRHLQLAPATVVVATGSRIQVPEQFRKDPLAFTDVEILSQPRDWRSKRVIVIDMERSRDALGTAIWLADRGAAVEVVTPFDTVGLGSNPASLVPRLARLAELRVRMTNWSELAQISGSRLALANQITSKLTYRRGIDAVIFVCNGTTPLLAQHMGERGHSIGDASVDGTLEHAIRSGHDKALEIASAEQRTH